MGECRAEVVVAGEGVVRSTLEVGDETHFADAHDEVAVLYEMRVKGSSELVDSTAWRGHQPLMFQKGSSGPCLHLQVLSGHRLHRTLLDNTDPYASVFWQDSFVGRTSFQYDTQNPVSC